MSAYPFRVAVVASADSEVSAESITPISVRTQMAHREQMARSMLRYITTGELSDLLPDGIAMLHAMPQVEAIRSVRTKDHYQLEYDGVIRRNQWGEGQSGAKSLDPILRPVVPCDIATQELHWPIDEAEPNRGLDGVCNFWGRQLRRHHIKLVGVRPEQTPRGVLHTGFGGYAGGMFQPHPLDTATWYSVGEAVRGDDRALAIIGKQESPDFQGYNLAIASGSDPLLAAGLDDADSHEDHHHEDVDAHTYAITATRDGQTVAELLAELGLTGYPLLNVLNVSDRFVHQRDWTYIDPRTGMPFVLTAGISAREWCDRTQLETDPARRVSWNTFIWWPTRDDGSGDVNAAKNPPLFGAYPLMKGEQIRYPLSSSLAIDILPLEWVRSYITSNRPFLAPYVATPLPPPPPPPVPPPCPLALSQTAITLRIGETLNLEAISCLENVTEATFWSSSNPRVATVSETIGPETDGRVTAKKQGDATITARYLDAPMTCLVHVRRRWF